MSLWFLSGYGISEDERDQRQQNKNEEKKIHRITWKNAFQCTTGSDSPRVNNSPA